MQIESIDWQSILNKAVSAIENKQLPETVKPPAPTGPNPWLVVSLVLFVALIVALERKGD
jgi:hypothetical protein